MNLRSFIFRLLVRHHPSGRPMGLNQLRPLWREAGRFLHEEGEPWRRRE